MCQSFHSEDASKFAYKKILSSPFSTTSPRGAMVARKTSILQKKSILRLRVRPPPRVLFFFFFFFLQLLIHFYNYQFHIHQSGF